MTAKPPAAFLSHSTADRDTAHRLATDLRAAGIDIWYADPSDHVSKVEKKIICFAE